MEEQESNHQFKVSYAHKINNKESTNNENKPKWKPIS